MKFTADFETTTNPEDCRVWATGICSIDDYSKFWCGNSIDFLFQFAKLYPDSTFYFHNIKFDGEFIINILFERGFKWISDRRKLTNKSFTTLISDKGMFYSMSIILEDGTYLELIDSLKILPFSVDAIAKGFGLPINKLKLDYDEYRKPGHVLTEHEKEYLRNDVEIVARALKVLFEQNLTKMTQGSNALYDYKNIIGPKKFKYWFPPPQNDTEIRQSYRGGFTYCNPLYKGKDVGEGIVLDVNSLYPWVMSDCLLPYGEPKFFNGQYKNDKSYPLYVQMITVNFDLKDGGIPTIQLKNNSRFVPTEYVTSTEGEEITLCLTNVDLELLKDNYDIHTIEYHGGWKYRGARGMFKDYIDKWYSVKVESSKTGNKAMRQLAKLMLNALYGKFGLNPVVKSKIPHYIDGRVVYTVSMPEKRSPIYIAMATFITAYARNKTIRSAMSVKERFIYADTDSLHLSGWELPENLDIDDNKLGAWKIESKFRRARFIRAKSYIEDTYHERKLHIKNNNSELIKKYWKIETTCAGMPKSCHKNVTWENFRVGTVYPGKLENKRVKGGVVLIEKEFTIRD